MFKRAVFLDRDGVINKAIVRSGKPYPPKDPSEVEILPGVPEALRKLKEAGFYTFVVTNQPDVARGTTSKDSIEQINRYLGNQLNIDQFFVCYHDDQDKCSCRKPLPGLILQGRDQFQIELSKSIVVGDRWRDIDAGRNAGCITYLVDYGYLETSERNANPDFRVGSLYEAVLHILAS